MSLVACPQCSGQVSPVATTCPHCGHPLAGGRGDTTAWRPSAVGFGLAVTGAAAVILGSFIPWVRVGPFTVSGVSGGGALTAFLGIGMLALSFGTRSSGSVWLRVLLRTASVGAMLIAGVDTNRIVEATPLGRSLVGPGPGVVFIGGLVALIGSLLRDKSA